ncbi:R1 protein, alpha-glucan water dikinase [Monoraphidium neglectum]|uniref:R1 protein, alpha-glucan water dikinase n=1 Tax=Monoraphidium neglectum TaxID=145388 RepID=A0A0D2LZN9_9CHLO|nr:R1 protein, alpha-glucan water dikinase [Monoraphidium neglectum]KIY94821.1 R1 protein, alpha-glucan water dikinase [Monoraphidium neglectum]|eukprot:XP_013893841.1 R1 protein, alpha-glucan water dikinase [Monoraphidium neglectum]
MLLNTRRIAGHCGRSPVPIGRAGTARHVARAHKRRSGVAASPTPAPRSAGLGYAGGRAAPLPPLRVAQADPQAAASGAEAAGPKEVLSSVWYDAGAIRVTATRDDAEYVVEVAADVARPMVLHWALDDWAAPPDEFLPPGTNRVDAKAVQTPFVDGRTVSLRFPADRAPERVVFVLKELSPENWINNGSQFTAQIKPPDAGKLLEKVLSLEGENPA